MGSEVILRSQTEGRLLKDFLETIDSNLTSKGVMVLISSMSFQKPLIYVNSGSSTLASRNHYLVIAGIQGANDIKTSQRGFIICSRHVLESVAVFLERQR